MIYKTIKYHIFQLQHVRECLVSSKIKITIKMYCVKQMTHFVTSKLNQPICYIQQQKQLISYVKMPKAWHKGLLTRMLVFYTEFWWQGRATTAAYIYKPTDTAWNFKHFGLLDEFNMICLQFAVKNAFILLEFQNQNMSTSATCTKQHLGAVTPSSFFKL